MVMTLKTDAAVDVIANANAAAAAADVARAILALILSPYAVTWLKWVRDSQNSCTRHFAHVVDGRIMHFRTHLQISNGRIWCGLP